MAVAQNSAPASPAKPVSDDEFATAMLRLLPDRQRVAVAVSGGMDSMALLLLARHWAGSNLLALTVDHGLRSEAAGEAQQVGQWCAALGIAHQILTWRSAVKPVSDIQAAARRARYHLLAAECARRNIPALLVAHHLEDQAETFLLRLARGSGVDGLASMADQADWPGLRVLRPLLDFPKQRLAATLAAAGQPWIDDPSNTDRRFVRPRIRAAMSELAQAGLSVERLAATAQRMQRARAALEAATDALLGLAVRLDPAGFAVLSPALIAAAPEEIGLRALSRVLMTVGGGEYPARMQRLEQLYGWLIQGAASGGRTLSGCRLAPGRQGLIIAREAAAIGPELLLLAGERGRWDGRFQVRLAGHSAASGIAFSVRAVAAEGVRQVMQAGVIPRYNAMPRMAYRSTPGLWQGDRLLAAPLLGFFDSQQQQLASGFSTIFAPIRQLVPVMALVQP